MKLNSLETSDNTVNYTPPTLSEFQNINSNCSLSRQHRDALAAQLEYVTTTLGDNTSDATLSAVTQMRRGLE